MTDALFHEVQRFRQGGLWIIFLLPLPVILFIFGLGLYQQLVLGVPFGNNPISDGGLVTVALIGAGIPLLIVLLLWISRLETAVTGDMLRVRYHPFHLRERSFALATVVRCEARSYDPIGEFGGWGLRMGWGAGSGWAYNVSGDRGVQLEFDDGRRLLIGSQRAEELAAAIRSGMKGDVAVTAGR